MLKVQGGIGSIVILPSAGSGNPPVPNFLQRVLSVSEFEIQVKGKNVNLEGQNQWPDDVMASDREGTIKITAGRLGIDLLNTMFGESVVAGFTQPVMDEGPTAVPVSPYQITVAGSANFIDDLGVINAATGQQLQPVASGPTAGQYSFAAGAYTFSSADHASGISVKISYTKGVIGSGRTLSIINHLQGYGPVNRLVIAAPYTCPIATSPLGAINVRSCRFTEVGLPFKRAGYLMVPISGSIFPDGSGTAVDIWDPASAS